MSKYPAFLVGMLIAWSTVAAGQPTVIPRLGTAPHDARQTYEMARDYLSKPSNGLFTIVRADPATCTVVAKRDRIDIRHWGEWAYCKLGAEQMLDTVVNGAATLTVKVTLAGRRSSDISVAAAFFGTYALGRSESTTQCISTGALEQHLLEALGAAHGAD
jgi:hypothetical protein